MRKSSKLILMAGVIAAIGGPTVLASAALADTVSSAPDCVPVTAVPASVEIQYKYTPKKNGTGPTHWAKDKPTATTQTIVVNGVEYVNANSVRKIEHPAVEGVTCAAPPVDASPQAVTLPQLAIEGSPGSSYVTVPVTPHVKTYLMGVQGHPETDAITEPVTVTPDMVGGQFWIKYEADEGYVPANEGTWHIDFVAAGMI